MGAYKNFLMGIEELVYAALESGARDLDSVYAYVYMHEKLDDRDTVRYILDELHSSQDMQLWVA